MSASFSQRALRALVLRVPPLRRLAQRLHESFAAERAFEVDLPELTPIRARAAKPGPLRLNLLLPGASARHMFGGAATALALFEALHRGEQRRILVTDERELEDLDARRFAAWKVADIEAADDASAPLLVPMADRSGRALPVHANDRFIATAWWTAHHAQALARWQQQHLGLRAPPPFVYLIQDYEPGFYPWSSRHALAAETYHAGADAIAVFNTEGLQRHVQARHPSFRAAFAFEPSLHPALAERLPQALASSPAEAADRASTAHTTRQRRILIYGRPSVPRNAFALIVQGLRQWVASDAAAARWEIVSLGEAHPAVPLGKAPGASADSVLVSRGKLALEDYAAMMRESAIGIGLMLSPHPSYPPLEMAAFGMRVLTNRFEGKALQAQHPNIHDLEQPTPAAIAAGLRALVARFEAGAEPWSDPPGVFARSAEPFGFVQALRDLWLADGDIKEGFGEKHPTKESHPR